jgi:mono/diheme cytochrome c family protein
MMRVSVLAAGCALVALPFVSLAAEGEVSVERGKQVSITGGCHDCHTANYNETGGQVDPALALKGTDIGWRGPWGTTYPMNLRLTLVEKAKTEDEFVTYMKALKTRPPMPWYNIHAMDESDLRSLFQYIKSLGEPGAQVPDAVPPDQEPKTPYYPIVPPTMPKG